MLKVEHLANPPPGFLAEQTEDCAYYAAFQSSGIANFEFGYLAVKRGDVIVAVAPHFITHYHANTTLPEGWLKQALRWLRFKIVCVGHPSADWGSIDGEISGEVLDAINAELYKLAPIVAYKDFPADLPLTGFTRETNLPVAVLHVTPDYFSRRSRSMRRNFRRKQRAASALRIEECTSYPRQHAARIYELYLETYQRAEMQFEKLTPQFFENMAPLGKYVLYWEGATLIGFSLLICKNNTMLAKYLGMDYAKAHRYGLYFAMLLNHIDICIRDGYEVYQTGQSSYAFKQKIGSALLPSYIYYRHRNPLLNALLALLMKCVAYDSEAKPA